LSWCQLHLCQALMKGRKWFTWCGSVALCRARVVLLLDDNSCQTCCLTWMHWTWVQTCFQNDRKCGFLRKLLVMIHSRAKSQSTFSSPSFPWVTPSSSLRTPHAMPISSDHTNQSPGPTLSHLLLWPEPWLEGHSQLGDVEAF